MPQKHILDKKKKKELGVPINLAYRKRDVLEVPW